MRKSLREHAAICSTAEDAAGRILQSACSPTPTRSRPKRRRRRSCRSSRPGASTISSARRWPDHHRARSGHRHAHEERAWTACRDCLDQAPVEDRIRRLGHRAQAKPASTPCSAIDPTSQAHAWLRADDACSRQTARQGASDQARRRRPPRFYCQARAARSPQTRHRCRAWLPRRYRY